MVDDRRAAILQAVVQEYIETSQPVSSSAVAGAAGVVASPATIRSEMAALERDGYLQQPHTSAGRIPTDRGYRFFVDGLQSQSLGVAQQRDVSAFFAKTSGEIEGMLQQTSRLLTTLTGSAALVVGPDHETTTVKSVQVVGINSHTVVAVVIYSNGQVEKRTVETETVDDEVVRAAGNALMVELEGKALSAVAKVSNALAQEVLDSLRQQHVNSSEHVYVGGAGLLAGSFDAIEVVSNVITVLEQQYMVVTLIRDLLDRGVSVSIGAENSLLSLAQCSLVVAPTVVDGEQRGSVAVLGPTRMDYSKAVAAVTVVSKHLGERLADTGSGR